MQEVQEDKQEEMTKKDGYKHRHKWVHHSWLYGVEVKVCEKCEKREK